MNAPTRDCQCSTHEGPHWLYADTLAMTLELLQLGDVTSPDGLYQWARGQQARLQDLDHAMRQAGMGSDESIEQYLLRAGWPAPDVRLWLQDREGLHQATLLALRDLQGH